MSNLVTGTVVLVVGGIATDDTQVLTTIGSPNVSIADGQVTGNIPANVAQSIQNGFYLMMTSNTTDGNSVINYSNRFTLIEMSGTTDGQVLNGATTQAGSVSNVPAAQYNVIEHPTPSSAAPTATATATTETATANSTATSDPFPGDGDGGHLSGPMLAGVIAGSILAAIGAISLVIWTVFFYKRIARKKREQKTQDEIRKSVFGQWDKAELPGDNRHSEEGVHMRELSPSQDRFEAPGWGKVVEAPGNEPVFELEGDIALWEAGSGRRSKAWDPTAN